MNSPLVETDNCNEVFLLPGDFYFGDGKTRIRTVLGSCIAITLWNPGLRIGGMCHYVLPQQHGRPKTGMELDGRYADAALEMFMRELDKTGSHPTEYEVKMFGGGNQFPEQTKEDLLHIPDHNISVGRRLLAQFGFVIKAEHLGGVGHRNVIFDVWSGETWIRFDTVSTG
jgi:chemotaxis protein CheD